MDPGKALGELLNIGCSPASPLSLQRHSQAAELGLPAPAEIQHTTLQESPPSYQGNELISVLSFHLFKHPDNVEEKVTLTVTYQLFAIKKIQI